jgi:triphosphoribosyl-dephospho-CoA synthase
MLADVIELQQLHAHASSTVAARRIALLAVRSLHTELRLHPKPGLVTPLCNGSHHDMTADTFMRSLFALRHYFVRIAQAGCVAAPFAVLRELGIAAECSMMRATRGINTHRGAIFAVGMLAAAIGAASREKAKKILDADEIQHAMRLYWGDALQSHAQSANRANTMPLTGARAEAASGFGSVFDLGLPTLRRALTLQRSWHHACVDTLFALITQIDDTNIVHRGGRAGAAEARMLAQQFVDAGATANPHWERHAAQVSARFVALNLSPGGAADLLAATCLVHWATSSHGAIA